MNISGHETFFVEQPARMYDDLGYQSFELRPEWGALDIQCPVYYDFESRSRSVHVTVSSPVLEPKQLQFDISITPDVRWVSKACRMASGDAFLRRGLVLLARSTFCLLRKPFTMSLKHPSHICSCSHIAGAHPCQQATRNVALKRLQRRSV